MRRVALLVALLVGSLPASATTSRPDLAPALGARIDLDLPLVDETGHRDRLAAFAGGKPMLILLGYDRCPNLCGVAERDLAETLAAIDLPADAYRVLFGSIDPNETPADAAAARAKLAEAAPGADISAWHFVTGDRATIDRLEAFLGMTVRPVERDFYVHPVAVAAVTGDGRLSRVLSGFDYAPRDLRLAIVEASENRLGTLGEHVLLLCSGFDLTSGRYTDAVMLGVQAAGIAALITLGGGIFLMIRRGRA